MPLFQDLSPNSSQQAFPGILIATVLENHNQEHPGEIKVSYCFGVQGKNTSGWVPLCVPYVCHQGGSYFLPEVGSQVVVSFILGNVERPIVLGSIWTEQMKVPETSLHPQNKIKSLQTKGGHKVTLLEEEGKESLEVLTPDNIKVLLSDEHKSATLSNEEGKTKVTVNFQEGTIHLEAEQKILFSVGGQTQYTIEASASTIETGQITLDAQQTLKCSGQTTDVQAGNLSIKGDASVKIESSGVVQAQGSLIKLN